MSALADPTPLLGDHGLPASPAFPAPEPPPPPAPAANAAPDAGAPPSSQPARTPAEHRAGRSGAAAPASVRGRAARRAAGAAPARNRSLVELLVRDPAGFVARIEARDVPELARGMIAMIAIGAGIFGAVVGSYRGGRQIGYAALKLPLLLVGTLVLCAPAFVAIARAAGSRTSARGIIALTLGASARFALVLAGLAPVVWLLQGAVGYHLVIVGIVAVCVAAGCAAAALLFRGLAAGGGAGRLAGLAFVAVYGVVGGHTAWMLRPFVVRPRTVDVPFVRDREGDLLESVTRSTRSSMGVYDREITPAAGSFPDGRVRERATDADEPASVSCKGDACD